MAVESFFKSKLPLVLMVASLLCGILFAIGHHLFYSSLNGRIIHTQDEQEWNIRIGTGLAFLVKLCLSTAVGIAYTQLLWSILKQHNVKLQTIDAMFSLPHSVAHFICLEIWSKAFILVPVGVVIWVLPLVAVFTPGALTVKTAPSSQSNTTTMAKPLLNFTTTKTFSHFTRSAAGAGGGPSNAFARLISTVFSQGRIQPYAVPFPNSEYDLDFFAPSISCAPMGGSAAFRKQFDDRYNQNNGGNPATFVAFVPASIYEDPGGTNGTLEDHILSGFNTSLGATGIRQPSTVDMVSKDYARLLFYVYPPNGSKNASQCTVECGFFNSSYQTTVRFDNNKQTVNIRNISRLNAIYSNDNATEAAEIDVEKFFAQVYLTAFASPLIGSVMYSHYGASSELLTTVFSTVLMQTRELNSGPPDSQPLEPYEKSLIGDISLAEAVEQLSHNVSLSLFSDPHFLRQDKDPQTIPLHAWGPQLEYTYNPRNVYIAYCVGVGVTAVVVLMGLVCIIRSSLAYGTSFSTILRTTRAMDLDRVITAKDSIGAEPLNDRLAEKKLQFRAHKTSDTSASGMAFQIADDASLLPSS